MIRVGSPRCLSPVRSTSVGRRLQPTVVGGRFASWLSSARPAGGLPPDSDVDVLVTFEPDASWGLLEQTTMESELAALLGRRVDLVSRRTVERSTNWIRRQAILESAETVHVAR